MVLFWTGTLIFSCCALSCLIWLKRWEMSSGRVVGARVRPHINRFFHTVSLWVERILPTLVRMYVKIAWRKALRYIHKTTAVGVVRVERSLERTLHTLKHTTDVRRGMGEASVFLREVSEHKRKLLKTETTTPVRTKKKVDTFEK